MDGAKECLDFLSKKSQKNWVQRYMPPDEKNGEVKNREYQSLWHGRTHIIILSAFCGQTSQYLSTIL